MKLDNLKNNALKSIDHHHANYLQIRSLDLFVQKQPDQDFSPKIEGALIRTLILDGLHCYNIMLREIRQNIASIYQGKTMNYIK